MYNKLDSVSPKVSQPENINIELKQHQRTALYAMESLEDKGCINYKELTIETNLGILADDPGSGKSMMIISLISNNILPKLHKRIHYGTPFVCLKDQNKDYLIKTNLIIVPYKLVSQWLAYFNTCNNLKVYKINTKQDLLRLNNIEEYDVIICSDLRYKNFHEIHGNYKWGRIIIDEVDNLKLPSMFSWNACFIWLITSYPDNLLFNNKNFIRMIFKNITSYILKFLIIKNLTSFVKLSIDLPKLNKFKIKCKTPPELMLIKNYVNTHIMDMLHAGNLKEAIKQLNCNVDTDKNIFQILTSNIQKELHNKNLEYEYHNKIIGKNEDNQKKILNISSTIKHLKTQLESIKKKVYHLNSDYCPICLDSFTMPTVTKCCKNVFCFKCIVTSVHTGITCPFCRENININDLNIINNEHKHEKKVIKPKAVLNNKLENLINILENKKDGNFIIFSNYLESFDEVISELKQKKIKYGVLSGSEKNIKNIIKAFDKKDISVLMMNSQLDNFGFDLPMVSDIILYHKLEETLEEMIVSRAYRLGRKNQLDVHYLLYETEYKQEVEVI
ncbi:SNF2 family N-terminal domain [seawater metagenome]|uniref:SNF2 family N-terminal domain n=1 Tax=seawater metagenome TaxID=1561972 RepID=A0A5E8CJX3_9ZZZZ